MAMPDRLRYFFDEHMPVAIAEQLRARGIDVLTALDAGRANQKIEDADQLRFATQVGCVLVTEDSDFVSLSASQQPHAGIVYFPIALDIGSCVEYLELLALTTVPDELHNVLLYGRW